MAKTIKLSDFKRFIESAKVHSLELKSKVVNKYGEVVKENSFAVVAHTQSNSFALNREGKLSWAEYGKASEWDFNDGIIRRNLNDGGYIIFEFRDPTFFSPYLK